MNLIPVVDLMKEFRDDGENELACAHWKKATARFSDGIEVGVSESVDDVSLVQNEDDILEYEHCLGTLFNQRGLSYLAAANYTSCLLDLSTATAMMPNPIFPLCCLSSIRATCDQDTIYCPSLALAPANIAIMLSRHSPEYRGMARLTRALAKIALRKFDDAGRELSHIPASEQSKLPDYAAYVECITSRSTIRRTAAEYGARIQMMFRTNGGTPPIDRSLI